MPGIKTKRSHLGDYLRRSSARISVGPRSLIVALMLSPSMLVGQNSPVTPPQLQEGTKIFAVQCAGCHGTDAHGTEHGPTLADVRRLRGQTIPWIRHVIHNGIPSGGMPAFDLPANELDALAALVHSLNSPAAESFLPGSRAAGEQYFFGKGKCSSCHMVYGRGEAVGPDLSNVAREMTVDELRTALLQPSAHIQPGYRLVMVRLRDGKRIRGFARSRTNFEIVVQGMNGEFHFIGRDEIAGLEEARQSLMPPVKASPEELQNLIAYLGALTGVRPGIANVAETPKHGGISWSNILHPRPGDWLSYNGELNGNRYSELDEISTTSANRLVLKWIFSVPLWRQFLPDTPYIRGKHYVLQTTPLVADGIMYVTGPNQAFALDARTGQEIWRYRRPRSEELLYGDAAVGKNRGAAILGDKVFMVTDNAHLIALNRTTGQLVWEVVMPEERMYYGSTVAPLVVKNMVVAGVSGGDWGVRGFIAAYKVSNGERLWRRWTIPDKGEPGAETWGGNPPKTGGGATWLTGSYDSETDTLYWPTGNPYPDSNDQTRPGDNLYTDCILALNPDNGKLKWDYQITPHDVNDWDATAPLVLVDTKYQGRERKLLLHADKNGFFYVLDRTNGHVLLAKNFVRITWSSGIGSDGRPELLPEHGMLCPGEEATNWAAKAFSPLTRLFYVMALEECEGKLPAGNWTAALDQQQTGQQYLRALDIDNGKVAWEVPQFGNFTGPVDTPEEGVLATAGGLLFYCDPSGDLVAAEASTGKALWHLRIHGLDKASPMTYSVDGKQFVALAVGPNILCFGLP
jgi:PQQ-dependent dehydrogenase (methanol/ethanol family)